MKREKKTIEQIFVKFRQVQILKWQGTKITEAIRTVGITPVTYYRWRKKYSDFIEMEAREKKVIEEENERLSRAVADLTLALDKMILMEAKRKNF
jgi:transposase-like protein